jgi:methylphosphotriester-DNA--protein-cysteine methyltransferase
MDVTPYPPRTAALDQQKFEDLCLWIDDHLGEPIGWQQLFAQSELDYQKLQILFYRYKNTTPMTWIRRRREAAASGWVDLQ